jgi:L-ascorbate peroxidase
MKSYIITTCLLNLALHATAVTYLKPTARQLSALKTAVNKIKYIQSQPDTTGFGGPFISAVEIRVAFHDAGTYDKTSRTGGADGSIMNELNFAENRDIDTLVYPIFSSPPSPKDPMSYADQLQLAGTLAVKKLGGPAIPFRMGRLDADDYHHAVNNVTNLPGDPFMSVQDLVSDFARMGLNKRDIITLVTGSHTVGRVFFETFPTLSIFKTQKFKIRKGAEATFMPFDDTPTVFDNNIFIKLKNSNGKDCVLPIDCAIFKEKDMNPIGMRYAQDQKYFFEQYKISFQKMAMLTSRAKWTTPLNV